MHPREPKTKIPWAEAERQPLNKISHLPTSRPQGVLGLGEKTMSLLGPPLLTVISSPKLLS